MNGTTSILLAFVTGLLFSVQFAINSQSGKNYNQYVMIIGVSLIQALLGSIMLFFKKGNISGLFSPMILISGFLGVIIMYGFSYSIGNLGTLKVFATVLAGQVIASLIIDHFGFFDVPQNYMNLQRLISTVIIMFGVYVLVKS